MVKVIKPFCWDQNFDPKALSAPAPGLYTCEKTFKNVYKIRVQRDFFSKLATNDLNEKAFLLTLKFWLQGFVFPGLYTCGKNMKKCVDCFKTINKWAKWWGLSVDINICPQGVVCPYPGAIYICKSIKIYTRTRCPVSVYRTTGPLVYWGLHILAKH